MTALCAGTLSRLINGTCFATSVLVATFLFTDTVGAEETGGNTPAGTDGSPVKTQIASVNRSKPYYTFYYFKKAVRNEHIRAAATCLELDSETARLCAAGFPEDSVRDMLEMRVRQLYDAIRDSSLEIRRKPDGKFFIVYDRIYKDDGKPDPYRRVYVTRDGKRLEFVRDEIGAWRFSQKTIAAMVEPVDAVDSEAAGASPDMSTPAALFASLLAFGRAGKFEKIAEYLIEPAERDDLPDLLDSEKELNLDMIRRRRAVKLYHWLCEETVASNRAGLMTVSGRCIPFVRRTGDNGDSDWKIALEAVNNPLVASINISSSSFPDLSASGGPLNISSSTTVIPEPLARPLEVWKEFTRFCNAGDFHAAADLIEPYSPEALFHLTADEQVQPAGYVRVRRAEKLRMYSRGEKIDLSIFVMFTKTGKDLPLVLRTDEAGPENDNKTGKGKWQFSILATSTPRKRRWMKRRAEELKRALVEDIEQVAEEREK